MAEPTWLMKNALLQAATSDTGVVRDLLGATARGLVVRGLGTAWSAPTDSWGLRYCFRINEEGRRWAREYVADLRMEAGPSVDIDQGLS